MSAFTFLARPRPTSASRNSFMQADWETLAFMFHRPFGFAIAGLCGACSTQAPSPQQLAPVRDAPPALVRGPAPVTPDDYRCLTAIRTYQNSLDSPEAVRDGLLRERMEIACSPPQNAQSPTPRAKQVIP